MLAAMNTQEKPELLLDFEDSIPVTSSQNKRMFDDQYICKREAELFLAEIYHKVLTNK